MGLVRCQWWLNSLWSESILYERLNDGVGKYHIECCIMQQRCGSSKKNKSEFTTISWFCIFIIFLLAKLSSFLRNLKLALDQAAFKGYQLE